ncbi:hypothetical protein [Yersinia wautersii]|nr:hypothetical protein [Yersinia wautersii]
MPYREGEESAEDLVRKEEVRKQVRSKIMLLSASLKLVTVMNLRLLWMD